MRRVLVSLRMHMQRQNASGGGNGGITWSNRAWADEPASLGIGANYYHYARTEPALCPLPIPDTSPETNCRRGDSPMSLGTRFSRAPPARPSPCACICSAKSRRRFDVSGIQISGRYDASSSYATRQDGIILSDLSSLFLAYNAEITTR